ncbi:MAG: fibronectin type III domain-containing protein [Caldilineaceae bacterium]|nr:fibronectin type III domain-containing protein [Caldilineaceae bacterium]
MKIAHIARILVVAVLLWLAGAYSTASAQDVPTATDAAPQEVVTGFSPSGLTRNDTHLFIARSGSSLETCGMNPGQTVVVLQRTNLEGGNSLPLLERCHFKPGGLVADNQFVYFRDMDNTLKRIPVDGSGSPGTLANNVNTCCGLAVDETHLYWGARQSGSTNNGIFRMPKAGGVVELLASIPNAENIYLIRDVTVDATHIYWVEGRKGNSVIDQPGIGAVRKVPKAGGAVVMLADAVADVQHPTTIALDETHVYWSEMETARARRISKNGGAVTSYNPSDPARMGQFVAVGGSHVYWTDTDAGYAGRLRRADKVGGNVTDLAIAILGPGRPLLTDSHVYWPQHDGVYRLPLGTGAVAVDFSIDAIEVTQTVQDMTNSVPLVAEKYTLVRVYPRVDVYTGQRPNVRLRAFRNGVELGWSPILPVNPSVAVFSSGANRFALDRTFNFRLPSEWRQGTVTLRAEINYDDAIPELNKANNTHTVMVNFNHKKPLCVEMVRVRTNPQTAATGDPGFHSIVDWLQASYPIPTVLIDPGGMIEEAGGPYELPDDTNKVLARLGWYRLWHTHNQWQQCGAAHFYGMVHPSVMFAGGIGYRPGWAAWGVMATHSWNDTIAANAPWYAPHGGAILAHEIAHNKGRKHVDCGGPDGTDNAYPYNPCNMGSGFANSHLGYDYFDEAVIGAWETGDLMSYSMNQDKPRWPSDYTYKAIFDTIPSAAAAVAASAQAHLAAADYASAGSYALAADLLNTGNVLLISALVTPTQSAAVYDQLYVVPAGTIPAETLIDTAATTLVADDGDYALRLIDAGDKTLAEVRFHLPDSDAPPWMGEIGGGSFVMAMPYADSTARVALLQGDKEILSRAVSANPPSVRVLEPNGGESYAGSLTVRWEASDRDGDPLRFLVQYSADNGATWRVVEADTDATTLQIDDVGHLPGTTGMTARVRVFANDGLRTVSDTSDRPFSMRMNPPQPRISNPSDGEIVAFGETLGLVGDAFDVEDGRVAESGLSWRMDGNAAGTGREVSINGLSLGKHTVDLTAIDSGQMWATVEHTFYVQRQYCDANPNRLDLVFVIDNAPAMSNHAQAFCNALPGILEDLADLGLAVRHQVFDVAAARSGGVVSACATAAVQSRWRTEIDHPGDWGKAAAAVATGYEWLADHTRLIVPVTNGGPEDGNPTHDPGADRDAIDAAIAAALKMAVSVSPLMMPPADSANFFVNMGLAAEIADATGGTVMQWAAPDLNVAEVIQDDQARLGCSPEVDVVTPGTVAGAQEVCMVGRHFWPGTTVTVGTQPASSSAVNENGALICFEVPAEVGTGEHAIRLERPGVKPKQSEASLLITVTPQEFGGFDLYLPMLAR